MLNFNSRWARRKTRAWPWPSCRWSQIERLEDRTTPSATTVDVSGLSVDSAVFEQAHILVQPVDLVGPKYLGPNTEWIGFGWYRVGLADGESVLDAVKAYAERRDILAAEPDYLVSIDQVPNDPSFGTLWGLNNTGQSGGRVDADIDATDVWDISTGTGQTVVAVIDSGVDYNHPDLAANIWVNVDEIASNGIDDDANGYVDDIRGWDFANNDNNPFDDNRHGTHVAGTIAAVGNNGVGVAGVNWHARIMPLKFLRASGSGSTSAALQALNYAVANGASVSNNSWGGGGFSQAMLTALQSAAAQGHIFVAAAGNSNRNTDSTANYPSNYNSPNVISVAATDRNDERASFSNYGATTVDLGAPGVSILSTTPSNTYSTLSGTSMASPHVAGAVALLRDQYPSWTYQQIISRLLSTVDPVAALAGRTVTGGRLNLNRALGTVDDVTPPAVTVAEFRGAPTTYSNVRLTFSEPIDATSLTAADVQLVFEDESSAIIWSVASVANGNGGQFDVTFQAVTAFGKYTLSVGPDVTDLAGNEMERAFSAIALLDASGFIATATNVPVTIIDLGTISSEMTVAKNVGIRDLNVRLTTTHTYVSDLVITLVSPWGQQITLFNRHGGSADNLNGTVFDDEASTAIASGSAPYSAAYRPVSALSTFDTESSGLGSRGVWTLRIQDMAAQDVGQLLAWSLVFNGV